MPPDERLYRNTASLDIRAGGKDEGVFEGYAVTWEFVDSYRSMFKKGAFAKTLNERGNRIKVKYNHETLIGKVEDAREDSKGLYVRGRLNLSVQSAKDVYEFLRDGTLDGLSFAFRAVKDHYDKGVRVFDEVQLYEFGPVDDPASDEAIVTAVREQPARATDFSQTLSENEARRAFHMAFYALQETLDDIWYMGREQGGDAVLSMIDTALTDSHGALMAAAQQFIDQFWNGNERTAPGDPKTAALGQAVRGWLTESRQTPESAAANTALTLTEIRTLMRGQTIADRSKLNDLPETVRTSHQQARTARFEELCKELREGLTPAQHQRVSALLSRTRREPEPVSTSDTEPDVDAFVEMLRESRAKIGVSDNA